MVRHNHCLDEPLDRQVVHLRRARSQTTVRSGGSMFEEPHQRLRRLFAKPFREAAYQIEIERGASCRDRARSIDQVHGAAGESLHCNEVLAPYKFQSRSLRARPPCTFRPASKSPITRRQCAKNASTRSSGLSRYVASTRASSASLAIFDSMPASLAEPLIRRYPKRPSSKIQSLGFNSPPSRRIVCA
jgi:hypothetical protein